jgi:hypothetical protein
LAPLEDRPPRRYLIGLWLVSGSLTFLLCMYHLSATYVDGVFIPAEHDSFYHARRILDALGDPLRMAQFDSRMHAPEGSWITWPWAYDMAMAGLARALMALTGATEPLTVLAFVAPAWVFVNAALFLGVASRLRLSLPMRALAMLFFVVSPLTSNGLHRVGILDHHYVEYTFVLASLYLGLGWFEDLSRARRAVALGVLLGAAPAFHTGLFILQLPVLLSFAWLWVLKRPLDRRATLAFGLALCATTALFLVPSQPFRHGEFSFYLHSLFHLYASGCTALLCVLASRFRCRAAALAGLLAVLVAMAVPALTQLAIGLDFLFAKVPYYERIGELGNPLRELAEGRWWRLTVSYSALVWLLPLFVAGLCLRLRRDASDASIHFLVQVLFGSFLMLQTFRLQYFGSFALILPLCRLIDDARERHPQFFASRARAAAVGVLVILPLLPGLLGLRFQHLPGSDDTYHQTRVIYPVLAAACRRAPGVVLADHQLGHYIRYHSECSVIANNFIGTPQQVHKIQLSEELLAGSAAGLRREAPDVRYVLVRRADNLNDPRRGCRMDCPENDGLRRELLAGERPPPGLRMLIDVWLSTDGRAEPYARLFEVTSP